jgi:hypothetical protein
MWEAFRITFCPEGTACCSRPGIWRNAFGLFAKAAAIRFLAAVRLNQRRWNGRGIIYRQNAWERDSWGYIKRVAIEGESNKGQFDRKTMNKRLPDFLVQVSWASLKLLQWIMTYD